MKNITRLLVGATTLALSTAPAFADGSDKLFVNQLRDKIAAARAEPGVAQNGQAELDRAEAALKPLLDNLDENETKAAKNITGQIDALIETARTRARIAAVKAEIAGLNNSNTSRVANAEASAAQAQADAARAKAEAHRLRAQMQAYQMKQTQLGATLVLRDVVFATGRADLKPGAAERHTDAQGSDAYNQALSDRRAASVRAALAAMGVEGSRIEAIGHGETQPLADNRTAAGRQQNRRVEVTLVGQQASTFAGG
jgi:outer membrane protein OmpA-like peptidoglycan-associated protein